MAALLAASFVVTKQEPAAAASRSSCFHRPRPVLCMARWWRQDTWRLQSDLARPLSPSSRRPLYAQQRAFLWWARGVWKHRARVLDRAWPPWSPAWFRDALCVHHFEASWHERGGLGPDVSGGMQIGRSEWQHFGGTYWSSEAWLTAPQHQLLVAFRYWLVSRWYPWPNTARRCGLL